MTEGTGIGMSDSGVNKKVGVSPMYEALENLNKAITLANEAADRLRIRLAPICLAIPREVAPEREPEGQSDIERAIRQDTDRLYALVMEINVMCDEVKL